MKKRRRTANTTKKRDAIDLSAKVGLMHKTCERTHANLGAKCITQREPTSSAGITGARHHRNQASRRSRYSAQARASELAGAKQAEAYPQNTCAQTKAAAPCTHPARPHHHPGIMQTPGIPAQQMQRTGTRERTCGSGTGQNPLAEHAQHASQPRSIAWGGGAEAAMKGGAPCFCRASGRVPATGAPMSIPYFLH